jgi:hypothetical protein
MAEGELSDLGNAMPKRKGREDIRWVNHEMLGKRAVVSLLVSAHRINRVKKYRHVVWEVLPLPLLLSPYLWSEQV